MNKVAVRHILSDVYFWIVNNRTGNCTQEELEEEYEEDYDECFSSDDMFGCTKEKLFLEGLSYVDSFSAIRNVLSKLPTPPVGIDTNLLLPAKAAGVPSHTLVLDLDETLVSCVLDKPPKFDSHFVGEVC